jgi:large subunit ribosomal protein L23
MKLSVYEVIQEPLITEKIAKESETLGKYAFRVHPSANKKQIKSAVEKIYSVHVVRVNAMNNNGKTHARHKHFNYYFCWRYVRFQS